jgi:hypothetical protein
MQPIHATDSGRTTRRDGPDACGIVKAEKQTSAAQDETGKHTLTFCSVAFIPSGYT